VAIFHHAGNVIVFLLLVDLVIISNYKLSSISENTPVVRQTT